MSDAITRSKVRTIPLYNAFRKYGANAFVVQSIIRPVNKEQMDSLEKFFIFTLGSRDRNIGYNVTAGGEGTLGVPKSPQFRLRISQRMKGKRYALGIKRSDEQKEGMRQRMMGNKFGFGRTPTSPKHIAALAANSFAAKTPKEFSKLKDMALEARRLVGWIVSEEQKQKISASTKGKAKSEETKHRMRVAFLARTTPEQRRSMSKLANQTRWNKAGGNPSPS